MITDINIKSVLNKIKALGVELPTKGILSGQGFSSLILEEIGFNKFKHSKSITINDIDVFIDEQERKKETNSYTSSLIRKKENYFHADTMYQELREYVNTKYEITGSTKNGLLNKTYINLRTNSIIHNSGIYSKDGIMTILDSFDMNNVQIGLNLENNEVYYTKDFEEFIKTGELKIINIHSPNISLLRYLNKLNTFGFYGNIEKEIWKIGFYSSFVRKYNFFTEKHLSKFKEEINFLQNHLKISERFLKDCPWFSYSEFTQDHRLFYFESQDESVFQNEKNIFDNIVNHFNKKMIFKLLDILYLKQTKHLDKYIDKVNSYQGESSNVFNYSIQFSNKNFLMFFILKYFEDKNLDMKRITSIVKTIQYHPELFNVFYNKPEKIEEVYYLHNVYNKIFKEYGHIVVIPFIDEIQKEGINNLNIENLRIKVEEKIKSLDVQLKEEKMETIETSEYIITEINNGLELFLEGEKQHHCVGGYSDYISKGYSNILSIKNKKNQRKNMTFEISPSRSNRIFLFARGELMFYDKNKPQQDSFQVNQAMYAFNQPVESQIVSHIQELISGHFNFNEGSDIKNDFNHDDIFKDYLNMRFEDFQIKYPTIQVEDEIPF